MSTYKEEEPWLDKIVALTVIALPASIAMMPVPDMDLENVALQIFAVLAGIAVLLVLRSGWLVNVLMMKGAVFCVVAASAVLGAVFGQHGGLPSALAWALLGAGAWLALLLTLVVGRLISLAALWPLIWLARFSFKSAPTQRGSYASPSPRRYSAPAGAGAGYSGAGYAAAAGATGYAAGQAWDDMLDPMNAANPLSPPPATPPPAVEVNPTTGMPLIENSMIDVTNHTYGDPAPIFEPTTPVYDYTPACDYSSNNNCGGGFDF